MPDNKKAKNEEEVKEVAKIEYRQSPDEDPTNPNVPHVILIVQDSTMGNKSNLLPKEK